MAGPLLDDRRLATSFVWEINHSRQGPARSHRSRMPCTLTVFAETAEMELRAGGGMGDVADEIKSSCARSNLLVHRGERPEQRRGFAAARAARQGRSRWRWWWWNYVRELVRLTLIAATTNAPAGILETRDRSTIIGADLQERRTGIQLQRQLLSGTIRPLYTLSACAVTSPRPRPP